MQENIAERRFQALNPAFSALNGTIRSVLNCVDLRLGVVPRLIKNPKDPLIPRLLTC